MRYAYRLHETPYIGKRIKNSLLRHNSVGHNSVGVDTFDEF